MEYARAAATGSGRLKNADTVLKMMIDEFPNHPLRPEKMSLRAFTLWQLGDITASTKIYNQIMKDYPESEWSRDLLKKRVWNDSRTIFEACAQAQEYKKPVKTYGFSMFFIVFQK